MTTRQPPPRVGATGEMGESWRDRNPHLAKYYPSRQHAVSPRARGEMASCYPLGPAQDLPKVLYAPDGKPWCQFRTGLECTNGRRCLNPWHRDARGIPEAAWWFIGFMSLTGWRWGDGS